MLYACPLLNGFYTFELSLHLEMIVDDIFEVKLWLTLKKAISLGGKARINLESR